MSDAFLGWYFAHPDEHLANGDGRPIVTDRVPIDFHRANEGLCAVARILEAKPS